MACNFNFSKVYGELGEGYINVHHLRPVSELGEEVQIDPQKDLIVLCANCHAMIHKDKEHTLSLEELKGYIS
jgi:putative restriction endonuclease